LGDNYNLRKLLTITFAALTVFYVLLGLGGMLDITNYFYFFFVQAFIGTFNAFLFPCMIAIMGHWFPKKSRGFIVGLWATCNNFGNIIGIQLAASLLKALNGKWYWLMIIGGGMTFVMTFIIYFFLVAHPSEAGVFVEDMSEQEVLIASATQKQVYDKVIRNSVDVPTNVI
jgi:sugar phosphate permease